MARTKKSTNVAKPAGPFYVMTDDNAFVRFDDVTGEEVYGMMHYIAREGVGEAGYAPSASYAEIKSDVDDMNAMYARGEIA